ncbi:MAG TPA: cytochrome c oxidase subunit II, partial [Methylophilaceae bacterium]|nr:cytochrome c oxidase subunit II [Methylophilaceae bacterium]
MQVFKKIGISFAAMLASLNVYADYSWNFPEPVTPMALDTLHVHNKFMMITAIIFFAVLAIMIYSIISHRKSKGFKA